jgi:3-oxoadipate enol-lactonase
MALMDDGCRLAYRLDGDPGAPVLLLSNSLGTRMDMWEPQLPAFLDAGFRVLRYDSRGHGISDAPMGGYSMDRLGRDVVGLLDALEIGKAHYCGLSMGGMVGQWLGYRAPARLISLVLANTAAYMGPPASWQTRIETVSRDGMNAIAGAVIERWFTPGFVAAQPAVTDAIRDQLLDTMPNGYAGCCAAIRDMDFRPVIPLISVPALVIGGTRDPATPPAEAETLAAAIKGTELRLIEAAHLSNIEQPETFTDTVLGFMRRKGR